MQWVICDGKSSGLVKESRLVRSHAIDLPVFLGICSKLSFLDLMLVLPVVFSHSKTCVTSLSYPRFEPVNYLMDVCVETSR